MTTATATATINALTITVTVQGRALDVTDDAQRAADACVEALKGYHFGKAELTAWRAEFAAVANGESEADPDNTEYASLINELTAVAQKAATEGWAVTDAFVTVDVA